MIRLLFFGHRSFCRRYWFALELSHVVLYCAESRSTVPPVTSRQRSAHQGSVLQLQIEHAIWSVLKGTKYFFKNFLNIFSMNYKYQRLILCKKIIFSFLHDSPSLTKNQSQYGSFAVCEFTPVSITITFKNFFSWGGGSGLRRDIPGLPSSK